MIALKFFAAMFAAASLATAAPQSSGQCTTGSLICCESVSQPGSPSNATDASGGLVSALISALDVPIGILCTPITVVGVGAGSSGCSATPTCCDSTQPSGGGLVGINCLPLSISL